MGSSAPQFSSTMGDMSGNLNATASRPYSLPSIPSQRVIGGLGLVNYGGGKGNDDDDEDDGTFQYQPEGQD